MTVVRFCTKLGVMIAAVLSLISCGPEYPRCRQDEDCQSVAPSEFCVNTRCNECRDDTHCELLEQCVRSVCEHIPGACDNTEDCSGGRICRESFCQDCVNDEECWTHYGHSVSLFCDTGRCSESDCQFHPEGCY